jgi:iron(III) transport system ATP-binding protein
MNFLRGEIVRQGRVRVGPIELAVNGESQTFSTGDKVLVCLRPEDVAVRDAAAHKSNRFTMALQDFEFLGSYCRARLMPNGADSPAIVADFSINLMRDFDLRKGCDINVALPEDRLRIFSAPNDARK